MNKHLIAVLLILLAFFAFMGCDATCKMLSFGCDNIHTVYVSHDPEACKSIKVDCSGYGDNGYFDRVDGVRYNPFSDSSGCGCRAITQTD
ncbi:MAG TPA: hypothetical protein VMT44_00320 [Methanoregula sp.]|nr:hypothetical protein [Methanoregula sp.]